MRKILVIIILFIFSNIIVANNLDIKNVETLTLKSGKLTSNLPYQKFFIIKGDISFNKLNSPKADVIQLQIKDKKNKVIFSDIWWKKSNNNGYFEIFVNKKLKYKEKYDLQFTYYAFAKKKEINCKDA